MYEGLQVPCTPFVLVVGSEGEVAFKQYGPKVGKVCVITAPITITAVLLNIRVQPPAIATCVTVTVVLAVSTEVATVAVPATFN
jgi:hypothetical protein